ncbi:hypothetical protein V1525DRAFT_374505 [Lipomyces kononenkoae]|uniref:Uncharacterized protein n=1 Tax=Lipomyces kononenkoae TaxID=34357 RepID=A0ACC3T4P8_LIPKO
MPGVQSQPREGFTSINRLTHSSSSSSVPPPPAVSPSLSATRSPIVPAPPSAVSRETSSNSTTELTSPTLSSAGLTPVQQQSQQQQESDVSSSKQPTLDDVSDSEVDAPTPAVTTSPSKISAQMSMLQQQQTPGGGPMPRRSHLKSRNGCLICKKRKIKCDEMRPQCRNCVKHNVVCSYASHAMASPVMQQTSPIIPHAAVPRASAMPLGISVPVPGVLPGLATRYFDGVTPDSSVAAALSARSSATTFSTPPTFDVGERNNANGTAPNLTALPSPHTILGQSPGNEIATQQLALLTNYILNTSKSLSNNYNPRSVYMWTHEVPSMACEFDFMMYSILALSATHLHYLRKDFSYENIAVYYRHRAIESFRRGIVTDDIEKTPTMLEALIIAGALVSVDAFAYIEASEYANNRAVTIDRWLPLLLGIKAVVIESDNMNEGHSSLHWNPHIHFLPVGERSLLYLSNLIDKRATELNQRELTYLCERPVRVLEQLITFNDTEFVELGAGLTRYIMTWPFVCSDEFIQKLKNHELVPLAIYVHYLAVMSFTKVWWQELRVKNDVRMICKILGRDWEPWLEWPKAYFDFDLWEDD